VKNVCWLTGVTGELAGEPELADLPTFDYDPAPD